MSKRLGILAALVGMALPLWAQRPQAAYSPSASGATLRTIAWQDQDKDDHRRRDRDHDWNRNRDRDRDRDHDRDRYRHDRDHYRYGQYRTYPYYGQYGRQYPSGGYSQYPYGGYNQYPYGGYNQYPYGGYSGRNPYGYGRGGYGYQGVLAPEWQAKFDSYYQRWLQYRATNNRDEVVSMERRMRDIMVNYRIPPNTPFDQVASPGIGSGYGYYRR